VAAPDLQQGIDVATASMDDYAERVVRVAAELPRPVSICGWSMGGLVAMLAARTPRARPHSLILIEPSPPLEVQGSLPDGLPRTDGTFDPRVVYGPFPPGVKTRPESSRARQDRKRGISVPSLPCPSLVIYGDEFHIDRGVEIARVYGSQTLHFPGLSHWDLVLARDVRDAIGHYLCVGCPLAGKEERHDTCA
jgi:pimeloyl-ACP methyl ester carboxylesterase